MGLVVSSHGCTSYVALTKRTQLSINATCVQFFPQKSAELRLNQTPAWVVLVV